jgi:outer membrane protein OmpA-like peptidoglycan-associated protein
MGAKTKCLLLLMAAATITTAALAEEVEKEGVIVSRSENALNIRTRSGPLTVVITPDVPIKETKGLSRKTREPASLIPGLIIEVEGDQLGDTLHANRIEFKERDWRAAIATKAGTTEQVQQITELRKAIVEGQEYVIRDELTVFFPTASAEVAGQYKQQLLALAQKAPSYGNYRVSILGFADPRGDPAKNERLSQRRAEAVSNYLRQTGHIQPGRVLSPSAMGEGTAAPGETTPTNNDQARRVVVRVITPKTQLTQ